MGDRFYCQKAKSNLERTRPKFSSLSMASSSTHHHQQIWNYDVFLSFRGEDTRKNFVDHLYTALKQKGIHVFKDDKELERGEKISPELLKAIEESRFSTIIFSENYAFSKWCLEELVKIMDCTKQKQTGHKALPIFYNVDPSHVRKQTGTYGKAFLKHENEDFEDKIERIQRWRTALTEASNISGWDTQNRHESELIQEIVGKIFSKLKHGDLFCEDNIVGMDFHMKEMNTLLSIDSNDVRFIGIYGLGGIGKTTIAEAIYNKISYRFDGCSFLKNVRERSKNGLVNLQKQLLNNILKVSEFKEDDNIGSGTIKDGLCKKRVLVILDDVDHRNQLKELAGCRDWFGPGSRIIITTGDEHCLNAHGVVERYKVEALDKEKSLELFRLEAFKWNHPAEDFMDLSYAVVNYTKGLPLALKVLGSFLCGRDKSAWISALKKLEMEPNEEIVQVLKISYDGLDKTEKKIFLDIACFFKGEDKEYVQKILDSCDFFAGIGMQVLKDRSLITISNDNEVLMHDLVQDMGQDIVHQECPENPGRRSRLWRNEDICHVLNNNVGTEAVEAIMTGDFRIGPNDLNLWSSHDAFMKMYNLRLLKMCGSLFQTSIQIKLPKILKKLKFIQLSGFGCQTEIPDLTEVPNVEHLTLNGVGGLSEIHTSVMLHKRLKYLSLGGFRSLRSLPSRIEMESLETLDLSDCASLKELPSSINNIPKLKVLNLSSCMNLQCLPDSICRLNHLEELLLVGCVKLTNLPEKLGDLESLVKLGASVTSIEEVPTSIVLLKNLQWLSFKYCLGISLHSFSGLCSLTYLNLRNCNLSNGAIPDDIGSLSSLETLDLSGNSFVKLPSSICQLSRLITFLLVGCKRIQALPELPSSIKTILADDCESLERLSNVSTIFNSKYVHFGFANCLKILKNQSSLSDAIELFQHQALLGNSETICLCHPGNDISGWFTYQNEGSSIGLQLPSNWYNSKLRGLAFCVVAGYTKGTNSLIHGLWEIVFSCNDSPMEIQIPYTGYKGRLRGTHVVLGYISRAWVQENEKGIMKAHFEFKNEGLEVMKCGIRLVYGDDDVDVEKESAKFFKERHQHHGESSKVLGLEELCSSFDGFGYRSESSGNDFPDGDHPSKRQRTFEFF